jgi:hypothetical protein
MSNKRIPAFVVGLSFVLLGTVAGQAAPPKDATGQCVDGSYTTAKTKEKGCAKHGGVKTWFADAGAPATPSAAPASTAPKATTHTPAPVAAQHTAARPKDATGQCADGTYTTAKTQDRGCAKHGGVKTWFGVTAATPSAAPAKAMAPSASTAPSPASRAPAPAAAPAPAPSVPGQVWVNTATKVYHCAGTRYYGNTKAGKYMSEADAKAAGYRADHGKACN